MRERENNKAAKLAWEMFEKTGKVEYYTLYRNLKNK
jgi:hypothetical protein